MTPEQQWAERRRQWQAFNQWERLQPPRPVDPAMVLRDLSAIRSWLPEEVRRRDPDPEKTGIQRMRTALALLDENR